jgi:drug/metabolite transporter (DMT)-like permease
MRVLAICLSLAAAVALAFGAQYQNMAVARGQSKNSDGKRVGFRALAKLVSNPRWLIGMAFLATGAGLQIAALSLAPLIVVQPLGAIALVITALLNSRSTKTAITKATWLAITLCTVGIAIFVAVAANVAGEKPNLNDGDLAQILFVLGIVVAIFTVGFFTFAKRAKAITFILGAGILYGFVASLIKAVVQRISQQDFSLLTLVCLFVIGLAILLGGWFVQNAYASGPPDLVIAGLTVVDPMVAIMVAIVILGEAQSADALTLAIFIATALVAIVGVWLLAKVHPELKEKSAA